MPPRWKSLFPSIKEMKNSDQMEDAQCLGVTPQQWYEILELGWGKLRMTRREIFQLFKVIDGDIVFRDDCFNPKMAEKITELPNNLRFSNENFILFCPNLKKIPEGMKACSLDLRNCQKLESLVFLI